MEIIDFIIPPSTAPVTPSSVIIAQFIPNVAGASGAPKHVAHAKAISGNKMIRNIINTDPFNKFIV